MTTRPRRSLRPWGLLAIETHLVGSATQLALVALMLLGEVSTASAYRTAADLPDFAGTERVRWEGDEIPFALDIAGAPGVPLADVERVVIDALSAWNEVESSSVRFTYLGVTSSPPSP